MNWEEAMKKILETDFTVIDVVSIPAPKDPNNYGTPVITKHVGQVFDSINIQMRVVRGAEVRLWVDEEGKLNLTCSKEAEAVVTII